jgi:hypothetical protein
MRKITSPPTSESLRKRVLQQLKLGASQRASKRAPSKKRNGS